MHENELFKEALKMAMEQDALDLPTDDDSFPTPSADFEEQFRAKLEAQNHAERQRRRRRNQILRTIGITATSLVAASVVLIYLLPQSLIHKTASNSSSTMNEHQQIVPFQPINANQNDSSAGKEEISKSEDVIQVPTVFANETIAEADIQETIVPNTTITETIDEESISAESNPYIADNCGTLSVQVHETIVTIDNTCAETIVVQIGTSWYELMPNETVSYQIADLESNIINNQIVLPFHFASSEEIETIEITLP